MDFVGTLERPSETSGEPGRLQEVFTTVPAEALLPGPLPLHGVASMLCAAQTEGIQAWPPELKPFLASREPYKLFVFFAPTREIKQQSRHLFVFPHEGNFCLSILDRCPRVCFHTSSLAWKLSSEQYNVEGFQVRGRIVRR